MKRRVILAVALALPLVLALPPLRALLESSMSLHMLVQFPLLMLAGFLLAGQVPQRWSARLQRWNGYGISGLLLVALVLSLAMIPRLLDLALVDPGIEAAKWLALLAAGAALRGSWQRAGLVVQGFFLFNVLPMMGVAGQLYQDSPLRLCNAYLLDDQVWLGQALVTIAFAAGFAWMAQLFVLVARRDAGHLPLDDGQRRAGAEGSP
jgi:hypothetical protein